ncbi:hypothetical protein A3B51_02140 [Candidatus Curtissbacteria bacterium RIFCSPLOWO2_01_FULL_41_18]|uniref:Glycosyltransferase 2-like domain-containing protein n=1 Tax=Candidatus Curtissbacteria bacterium RIFCSPLOWO2_01_FULL_41_18 TaxID=1797727 RepID=A0A1F5HLK9_9BACT|nr:MAG: hypothetical protein A3B51_02140 [Candidatus Curtissbacteria bacterium RIFCSPLOWO2_01_FULL_41_18]
MKKLVSIIIPVFNEQKVLTNCLESLKSQSYKPLEIIVVDDGSTDNTLQITKKFKVIAIVQNHKGPGPARNLGAKKARGEILVFVDADMTFDRNFIKDLTAPILKDETIGTFSRNEMNANKNNIWSQCWNINRGWPKDRLIPQNYPQEAPVFRAILKSEFDKVNGYDATGEYTDDWSLSKKLGIKSAAARGAVYYHSNPATLSEVWMQARWIGKNEFIAGTFARKIRSLIRYSLPISILIGIAKSIVNFNYSFLIFKLIYDLGIWISVVKAFFGEAKSK